MNPELAITGSRRAATPCVAEPPSGRGLACNEARAGGSASDAQVLARMLGIHEEFAEPPRIGRKCKPLVKADQPGGSHRVVPQQHHALTLRARHIDAQAGSLQVDPCREAGIASRPEGVVARDLRFHQEGAGPTPGSVAAEAARILHPE